MGIILDFISNYFALALMEVITPESAHSGPFSQRHINTINNFTSERKLKTFLSIISTFHAIISTFYV